MELVVLGLVAAAIVLSLAMPVALRRARWQVRHPRRALITWHAAFGLGVACLVTATVIAVGFTAGSLARDSDAGPIGMMGWLSLVAVGGIIALMAGRSEGVVGADDRHRDALLSLPHTIQHRDGVRVAVCADDAPFACAVPGDGGLVIVTTGLEAMLEPSQLRAVILHESAHLRQHHHIVVRMAEWHVACTPTLPAARELLRASRLLVELIADDESARRCGAAHLANALVRMSDRTGDTSMEARAERLAARRWRRPVRRAWSYFAEPLRPRATA